MVTGTPMQGSASGAGELLAHLRQHPEDLTRSPSDLAATFGLSDNFVRTVLDGVQPPPRAERRRRPQLGIKRLFTSIWRAGIDVFERLNSRPALLVVSIVVVWFLLMIAAIALIPGHGGLRVITATKQAAGASTDEPFVLGPRGIAQIVIASLAMACSFAVFYRQRMSRYAVISGFAVFIAATLIFIPFVATSKNAMSKPLLFLIGEMGWAVIIALYVGIGSLVAVTGGWFKIRKARRELTKLSRHELLVRYFNIERRLRFASVEAPGRPIPPIIVWVQQRPQLWAFSASVILSAVTSFVSRQFSVNGHPSASNLPPALIICGVALTFLSFFLWIGFAFLAGRPGRAAVTSLCWSAGGLIDAAIVPMRISPEIVGGWIGGALINAAIAAMIGVGALVQKEAHRERLLARNDPATLLAELLQLQFALSEGQTQVCVLVIDAAKSAMMKASADPLVVEFSFRAYQAWIARISHAHNGRVYTVTGDGAIVAFATCGEALSAAQDMQSDVKRFNEEENRLTAPFRLRIGLHSGEVVADLDKVEFTEVIDIAAHVEAAAPVGGIALTDRVVEQLAGYHFDSHVSDVDGHAVFVARKLATP